MMILHLIQINCQQSKKKSTINNIMKTASKLAQKINWFPGHMKKALRIMQESTRKVDVFLEIRDARIPFTSKNSQFDVIIKQARKEKVIIFNKMDLCDEAKTNKIIKDYNQYGITCFGVSTGKHDDMRKIIGILKEKYQSKYKQVGLWLMTYGMPNVGKSSLLNQIRNISDLENKRTASKVTASVCTTKGTKGFKILQNPLMYLMDSPGVSIPSNIPNEIGLKLALTGIIKERVVDKMILLEFMMELFEKQHNDKYWKNMKIDKPVDFTHYFELVRQKYKIYDYDAVCDRVLTKFRQGQLGSFTLDDPTSQQM